MNPASEVRAWRSTALVFAAAFALRLAHVLTLRDSPYFARPVLDAETYYWAARALAAKDGWAEAVYWQPPGYPYFLAAVLWLAGPGFLAPRLVQAVLGALSAALTCAIGTRVFGRAVGLGAGLAVALYGVVTARYRAPLIPLLALFAAAGVRWAAVEARLRARATAAVVAVAVYLLANLGQGPMSLRMNSDAEQGLAHWLEREGQPSKALALYEQLAHEAPGSFDAWYGVAQLATALGQSAKADAALARIRGLEPEFPDTALLLARAALDAGCGAEADAFARRAVALAPRSDLARTLLQQAHALQAARPAGPPGGCTPRVFVAPFPLAS